MFGVCRVCGCTDSNACVTEHGACHWVDESHELCSACIEKENTNKPFLGFTMDRVGRYPAPVHLRNAEEILRYCELQKHFQHEIRIVDREDDALVVHVVGGQYIFPKEWMKFNGSKDEL